MGFYVFGQDFDIQFFVDGGDVGYDGLVWFVGVDVVDQVYVDFDQIGLVFGQQVQVCIVGVEIIDGGMKIEVVVFLEDVYEVWLVVYVFFFGYFENDVFDWKVMFVCCFEGVLDVDFWVIYCIGQEID